MTYNNAIGTKLKQSAVVDVLRLIRSENVGPITFCALMQQFGSVKAALEAIPSLALAGGKRKPIMLATQQQAETEIEAAIKAGARLLTIADADYPALLTAIYDPPPIITVLGNAQIWNNKQLLAIVGARNASANGCQFARKLAQDAGAKNFITVSGLARGIDTATHVGSLATGTVAVVASGIGQIYPPENKALHDEIAAKGCIITEQPFNALPHSRAFPGRNRIIAGMSHATVIVEAALKSGSLITAKYALDQNRDVFAVPGSPLDPRCKGTNHLLKQGAHLCEGIEDIIENLHTQLPLNLAEDASTDYAHNEQSPRNTGDMTEARTLVASKLSYSPVQVDELLAQCRVPPNTLSFILLELELAGRLQRHPGHKVSLVAMNDSAEAV